MSDDAPNDDSDVPTFIIQEDPSPDDVEPDDFEQDDFEQEKVTAPKPENVPLALGVGAVVAVLGGALWATVTVMFSVQLGILAWAIGFAVGGAILFVAKHGETSLGISAGGVVLFGFIVAKILIAQFGYAHVATDAILETPDSLADAVYHDMVEHDEIDSDVASFQNTPTDQRRPSPQLDRKLMRTEAKIASRVQHMSEDEKRAIAQDYADHVAAKIPFTERMRISGWEFLWLGLAIYTAFRICTSRRGNAIV